MTRLTRFLRPWTSSDLASRFRRTSGNNQVLRRSRPPWPFDTDDPLARPDQTRQLDQRSPAAQAGSRVNCRRTRRRGVRCGVPDWLRTREAAAKLAPDDPSEVGWLRLIEARLASETATPWRPMPAWWTLTYEDFWRSGKLELVASVGRRGTKSSSWCRVGVQEILLRERRVEPGTELVMPVLSCDTTEANGRQRTLRALLKAIGLEPVDAESKVRPGLSYWASSPNHGRSQIVLHDAAGNEVRFRITPSTVEGASGYTGLGGLGDEMELGAWAQPGGGVEEVMPMWRPTLKGQRGARLYLYSAPYGERGPHTRMVAGGSTDERYVATLGELGARLDTAARKGLAALFAERATDKARTTRERERFARYSADPRLLEEGDPSSTAIPSWAANPTNEDGNGPDPVGAIRECFRLASADAESDGSDALVELLARYGARPMAAGAARLFDPVLLDEAAALAAAWP
jgi:hypothetical protein